MPTFIPLLQPCEGRHCVGFNSFGFSRVQMGRYSPASRHFNAIYCYYVMEPYHDFAIPERVQAYGLGEGA